MAMLTGCSGYVKPSKGAPTMEQVYQAGSRGDTSFNKEKSVKVRSMLKTPASDISGEQIINGVNDRFPKLQNPESLMYIFGHYADDLPVPGHFTTFSLYDRNYYALPSEQVGE
jgi:conjugative transfer region lipoprotein (TIGR03751 family)